MNTESRRKLLSLLIAFGAVFVLFIVFQPVGWA